jgi:hypothetical protein
MGDKTTRYSATSPGRNCRDAILIQQFHNPPWKQLRFLYGTDKKKKKTPANVPKDVACFPVALLPSLHIFYTFKMIPFLIPFHRKRRNF